MRLLRLSSQGELSLTVDLVDNVPPYAILSHTWGPDSDEVTFDDLQSGLDRAKAGYAKILFCGKQAKKDGLEFFWVDTCCINKANHAELSEAITSMFRWYHNAVKCYVYLADVCAHTRDCNGQSQSAWDTDFRTSRWFTRGWTLQELLAPNKVEFFSREEELLGDKQSLVQPIHEITQIPTAAINGSPMSHFSVAERMRWAVKRRTKKPEDKAYCLLGMFGIFMPLIYGEGENAFVRLQEEISKRFGSSATSTHMHWMVPRTANSLFTGREDILQSLDGIVRDAVTNAWGTRQCRIVISGMGGQGKSEICLQLARRLRHLFWAVLWIDVSSTDMAEKSFLEAAQKLCIPAQTWGDACFGIANLKHPWLLVLDNADTPDIDYQNYFPDGALGVVMLTSRNDECQQYATNPIALEGLHDVEARELLLRAARVPKDQYNVHGDDAHIVASLLQSHALALIQAGAYISRGHCTLADYPRVYERQRRRLLAYRPTQAQSRYRDVYTTFEVSVETLKTTNTEAARDALQLLPLLATCGPSRLPLSLFKASWEGARMVPSDLNEDAEDEYVLLLTPWHVAHVPALVDPASDVWDSFRLVEAVSLLKAFSLVSIDSRDGSLYVSTHALVHAWARDRQNDGGRQQTWVQMGCLVALALNSGTLTQEDERSIQSHVQALAEWDIAQVAAAESRELVIQILVTCGWYLLKMRADAKLSMLMQRIFTYFELNRSKVEGHWIDLYDLTARNLHNYGKVKEAVALLEEVVRIRSQSLAEDHPSRLTSQHELAIAYNANGQVKDAIALLEEVVRIESQLLAEDHPDRLASQHVLAIAYEANEQVKDAVVLLEEVVRIESQSLAEDHPSRLASQHQLAGAYKANRQVKDAVALLEKVVRIKSQSLAEDHPDQLASQHQLAIYLWSLGESKAALAMMAHVVELRRRVLDDGHPHRQKAEDWLVYFEDKMAELKIA